MKNNPAQVAIDFLENMAVYNDDAECNMMTLLDDELYYLCQEFTADHFNLGADQHMDAYLNPDIRRMFFYMMAQMLKTERV